jgi:hypothetical protein
MLANLYRGGGGGYLTVSDSKPVASINTVHRSPFINPDSNSGESLVGSEYVHGRAQLEQHTQHTQIRNPHPSGVMDNYSQKWPDNVKRLQSEAVIEAEAIGGGGRLENLSLEGRGGGSERLDIHSHSDYSERRGGRHDSYSHTEYISDRRGGSGGDRLDSHKDYSNYGPQSSQPMPMSSYQSLSGSHSLMNSGMMDSSSSSSNMHIPVDINSIKSGKEIRTTIMVRHIPSRYTQDQLIQEMTQSGFREKVDFVYQPVDFRNGCR